MKHTLWINLYVQGYWHRQGKPLTTNIQAGDVYITKTSAMEAAETDKGYITTVPFELELPDGMQLVVNPHDSVPIPLSVTKPMMMRGERLPLPWLFGAAPETPSLEVGDHGPGDGSISYEEWRRNREASGFAPPSGLYKPAHGGYPDVPHASQR